MADQSQNETTASAGKSKPSRLPQSLPPTGELSRVPLPRILLALYRARFDGSLSLTRVKTNKRIVFQEGAPIQSESNLAVETLGAQLLDQGTLSREDLARATAYMQRKECREGVALIALELLDPKRLFLALKWQVRRRLLEAFAWAEGDYALEAGDGMNQEVQPFRSDPYLLVREGLVAHWSPDRLLADLTPFIEKYPAPGTHYPDAAQRLKADEVTALLSAIDGKTLLGNAIASGFNSPTVLATVWILARANLISFSDTALDAKGAEPSHELDYGSEVQIDIVGGADDDAAQLIESPVESHTDGTAHRDTAASPSGSTDATEAMRKEVLSRAEQLDEHGFYELLGVPHDADASAIRRAYFAAAKRYHPDALTRLGLSDVKQEAALVFARIAEANETLKNPKKRNEYDASLDSDHENFDANVVAQAETFFRKGEILVRMGDFKGAVDFFQPAVDLWPEECAYQSALGWALYKQPRAKKEAAQEHLEKAVELDPEDSVALFRLGVVLRAVGESDRAAECIARAKMLDPKVS